MSEQVVSGIGQTNPLTSRVFGSTIRAFNRLSEEQRSRARTASPPQAIRPGSRE